MCQQFRFDNKSQFRVFLAKPQKAADLKTKTRLIELRLQPTTVLKLKRIKLIDIAERF